MSKTGLQVKLYTATEQEEAAAVFHRDGFVCIRDALTLEQLRFAQQGAQKLCRLLVVGNQ
jgi:hypothetical protein